MIGGSPIRLMRLTAEGARLVDRWDNGEPLGPAGGARHLARRLVDAGIAHPRPPRPGPFVPTLDRVAVVIPVLDDPAGLEATLTALAQDRPTPVVVCDDGSVQAVRPSGGDHISVIRRPSTGGPAAARNTAWRSSTADIIVFVDADCRPAHGWLDALLPHFADPSLAAAAPRIVAIDPAGSGDCLAEYERRHSPLDLGAREAPVYPGSRVSYVPTAALAVRREALVDAGGFDEALRFGEDVDLVWRLAKMGWRIRYEPAATVAHPARSSGRSWLRQRFDYGRSAAELAARHGRDVAPLAVSPWSLGAWSLVGLGYPLAGAGVMAATAVALARQAGPDRPTAAALLRLGGAGNVRAAGSVAEAVRRAWLPPAGAVLVALLLGGSTRAARRWTASVAACLAAAPVGEWVADRPHCGPLVWTKLRLADDLAYQAGVWGGVVDRRSPAALLPRWWRLDPRRRLERLAAVFTSAAER